MAATHKERSTMKTRVALVCLGLASLIGACKPASAPTPDAVATAPAVVTPAAPVAPPPAAAAAADFDIRAFAGVFSGVLTCTDCADVDTRVTLAPDGTFRLSERPRASMGPKVPDITGTWTAEDGGTQILLDPDSKAVPDRRYDIVSRDQLATPATDEAAGKSVAVGTLLRQPATP
jgi:copper homeostasis protein (lipoprotein)